MSFLTSPGAVRSVYLAGSSPFFTWGPFDPSQFVDRYEAALKALIEEKQKGHKPAKVAAPEDTNVVDLMAALRASLNAKDKTAAKPAAKGKPPAKSAKAPAKAKARKAG